MMTWLNQGAPFDEVAPKPTALEQAKINEWEAYLNGTGNPRPRCTRQVTTSSCAEVFSSLF
jgi:hypothetical protein